MPERKSDWKDSIWYMAVVLGVVGGVAGAALAAVRDLTAPVIEQRILEEKVKPSLDRFFGPLGIDNDPIAERVTLDLGKDERGRRIRVQVFPGKKGGQLVAAALQTSDVGFGGEVVVLTALDVQDQRILGVKTIAQSETKGLGARVADDSEPFIQQFQGMPYAGGVKLAADGGQVEVISGASVTSGAFTRAVNKAVSLLEAHEHEIAAGQGGAAD